jgi:antitoxin component of MazEF toxin-antitoxin module
MVYMPVFESTRKVQTFGTSLAVTLPAMFVKANEIEKGSFMKVLYGLEGVLVASKIEDHRALRKCLLQILENLETLTKRREASRGDD